MARIYYLDEKLCGEPIEYPCINSEVFDFIFQNADTVNFEFLDTSDSDGLFGYVQLSNDGIWYESGYGSFYLPVSIIFSDRNDFVFPSEIQKKRGLRSFWLKSHWSRPLMTTGSNGGILGRCTQKARWMIHSEHI